MFVSSSKGLQRKNGSHLSSNILNTPTFACIYSQITFMKYIIILVTTGMFFSCSPTQSFNRDKAAFEASKVTNSFVSVADMNDSHFEIRENNFFEFYRSLFDSVKNTRYPGRYTLVGDTFHLKFYDKKGKNILGNKALIINKNEEIIFFK